MRGCSLRGRRLKGKGKRVLGARETGVAREEGAPRVSLAPKTPFPFPFKRLPRRLQALGSSGRKRERARARETREGSRVRPFFLVPTTSKRLLRRLAGLIPATGPILRVWARTGK